MSVHKPMMYGVLSFLYSDGKLLMVQKPQQGKDPNSGFYTPPGGKLEDNEKRNNPKGRLERAIMETQQETGLTPTNLKLKGIIMFDNHERTFARWPDAPDYMVYVFTGTEYMGKLAGKGDGEEIPQWIPQDRISTLPKSPGDNIMYEWVNDGRFFMGVIKHKRESIDTEGTFIDYF